MATTTAAGAPIRRRWFARVAATVLALAVVAPPAAAADVESSGLGGLISGLTEEVLCGSILHGVADGLSLCSHGDDDHLHPEAWAAEAAPGTPALGTVAPACIGDGVSGQRVEVLVVDVPGGQGAADGDVRRWVGQVDWTFQQSAARSGGQRQVRWVTEATTHGSCRVKVRHVAVAEQDVRTFGSLIDALADRGFVDATRKYLLWVDSPDNFCGIATSTLDDSPRNNAADRTVGYARVDRDCWASGDRGIYSVAAHEVAHTLGAVQSGAPNAAGQQHCTDEWDLMCYADGADESTMRIACDDGDPQTGEVTDPNNALLDCNGDDYFTTGVPTGWLATHWNIADSAFLVDAGRVTQPLPTPQPSGPAGPSTTTMPGLDLGQHAPVTIGGARFDACQLPIEVLVTDRSSSGSGGLLGLGGSNEAPSSSAARSMLEGVASWAQAAVGRPVLSINPLGIRSNDPQLVAPPADTIVVSTGSFRPSVGDRAVPTRLDLEVSAGRIRSAVVTLDEALVGPDLEVWGAQAIAQALGLGRAGGDGSLMAAWPEPGASRALAGTLLRHLYGEGACGQSRTIADTTGNHASQRRDGGSREQLHLADRSDRPIDMALDVATWMRSQRGQGWASDVVVCRDDVHADCLAGSGLVGRSGSLLFVPGGLDGRLPAAVADEVRQSISGLGRVWVLGGTRAVSEEIEQELRNLVGGARVHRLAGSSRFETATVVATTVRKRGATGPVLLARADDPVDAVAAGALAARDRLPVILTNPTDLPGATAAWLETDRRPVIAIGGERAVSAGVLTQVGRTTGSTVDRISGADRYLTALALARHEDGWDQSSVSGDAAWIFVNGQSPQTWAMALAASPVASHLAAPVLYVSGSGVPDSVRTALAAMPTTGSPGRILTVAVGGASVLPPSVASAAHGVAVPGHDGNVE